MKALQLIALAQLAIGAYVFAKDESLYRGDRQSIGSLIVVLSLILIVGLRKKGSSLLDLWVEGKKLEQQKRIQELRTTPSSSPTL